MSDNPREASIYWEPEWDPNKGVCGSEVQRVTGEELVQAMRENVREAMENVARARANLHRLKARGAVLIDADTNRLRPATVGEGRHKRPDPYGDVGISDWIRAVAELAHWQEYLDWAKGERAADTLPDRRLPPEPEYADDSVPF